MLSGMSTDTPPGRPRILLDCDPGHDDVVAILVANHAADLVGITTVAGNAPLDRTTYNACVMRDLLGLSAPVHSGANRPLVAPALSATFVHGESGLDGADLPAPRRGVDGTDAVGFIIETCRAEEGTWLVPTGPLTNVALALRAAPDLVDRIAGISLMGGGTFGNRDVMSEFNIWADPEAAAMVFACGVPLTMAGLDVTHQFLVTHDRIRDIDAVAAEFDSKLAGVLAGLFRFFADNYISRHDDLAGAPLHDPLAVIALTHPHLVGGSERFVTVETRGEHTRGMTVIDRRQIRPRPDPNCTVLDTVDAAGAWQLVVDAVRTAAPSH